MIARLWRGQATPENAAAYQEHFDQQVYPALAALAGYKGAWLLRRDVDGSVEFLAVTMWDSLGSIKAFAGDDVQRAVVEPEARAVLESFDSIARHFEVVAYPQSSGL